MDCAGLLTDTPPAAKKHTLFNGPTAKAGFGGQVKLVKSLGVKEIAQGTVLLLCFTLKLVTEANKQEVTIRVLNGKWIVLEMNTWKLHFANPPFSTFL